MSDRYDFEIEHVGFEIHPETPLEGVELKKVFPGSEKMVAQLKSFGLQNGVDFGPVTHLYHTHKALRVGELSKDHQLGNEFADVMFKAYFVECLDINAEAVLIELGESIGLEKQSIVDAFNNADYENRLTENQKLGRKYDIRSVPTFIINDQYKIVGSQSQEEIAKVFDKILSE